MKINIGILFLFILHISCVDKKEKVSVVYNKPIVEEKMELVEKGYSAKTIHILVALCDNKYQGIVPVPSKIGNGQDPHNNLYWGTDYGIKTYFKRSKEWTLLKSIKKDSIILERLIFKHKIKNYYLVADAYDGKYIKNTTIDFLGNIHGNNKNEIKVNEDVIGINGSADLVAYIGHNGLMDFSVDKEFNFQGKKKKTGIILACFSKPYFEPKLDSTINPLVWSTGLMAPEAYTIHDAITGYINNETNEQIRLRAAKAYSKYQKCSVNAAKRLLVTK